MSLGGMAKLRSYHYKLIMSSFLALQIAMKIFNTRQSFIFYQLEITSGKHDPHKDIGFCANIQH